MSKRDLKYRIFGDNQLGHAVGGAIGALGKLSRAGLKVAGSMVSGMAGILKRGLQVGFAGSIAGAIWSVKDSMAVGEMESKFDAVFKAMSGSARDWSKDFASSTKRSEYDVRGWMASIQDTLVPMGVARGEAAKLSQEITALGVDISSFSNINSSEAIDSIIGALVGNHMNVRKFGVVLTEAGVAAEAAAMGFGKANKPLTEQQKLLARLRIIQKGTTDAQGDAVRTSGSLANRWVGLVSIFKSFRVEVGNQIVEGLGLAAVFGAMERGIGGFIAKIKESKLIEEWAGKVKGLLMDIGAVGKALATPGKSGDVMKAIGNVIWEAFKAGAGAAVGVLLKAMPILGRVLGEAAKAAIKGKGSMIHYKMGALGGGDDPDGRKAAGLKNVLAHDPSMYLDLEREFKALIDKKDVEGAKKFARGLGKLGVDPDKLLAGDYRPGAEYGDMLGGAGGLPGAIESLKDLVASERAQVEAAVTEPAAGKSDDDFLKMVRANFQEYSKHSDAKILSAFGRGKAVSGSPASDAAAAVGGPIDRKSISMGDVFTRLQDGVGGTRDPMERMVRLQEETNRHLGKLVKKDGGGGLE